MDQILAHLKARYAGALDERALLQDRPALPDTLSTLLSHRSVRAFASKPLGSGTLELLVAAAQSAASSSNLQTWSVVAVEDAARKQRLSVLAGEQAHIREAPLFLAWLVDLSRLRRIAERDQRPSEGLDYLDSFLVGAVDAALAAQNAVVAAESLGLGTVYIGALRNRPEEVARELGLPPSVFALFGLCVGHPDEARPAAIKPRLPQRSVLFRERYLADEGSPEPTHDDVASYDQTMAAFYASQNMSATRWSQVSRERMETSASLRGRDRLREALRTLGFPLR
jgi:nitroreductase